MRPESGGPAPAEAGRAPDVYGDWEQVYRDNVRGVYGLIYGRVGNRADAEDLTAEVFMAVLRPLRLPAPVDGVRAYLVATARTVLASFWRRHYASPPAVPLQDPVPSPSEVVENGRATEWAAEVLSQLPDRFRQILELRFLRGFSVRQAAQEMGVSTGNAKVLQHRALRCAAGLRDRLAGTASG